MSAPVLLGLTLLLFALPVALYLWFISADGVNMLRADQWFDVDLIQSSLNGHLSFSMLWAQHGDNRIFFQNLVTLLLGHLVHFNVIVEEFINAALLIAALVLLILAHRRRAPTIPWIAYVPVAIVLLPSPNQATRCSVSRSAGISSWRPLRSSCFFSTALS